MTQQQSPQQRLQRLEARKSHALRIKTLLDNEGWLELAATMEAEIKRRRIARDSLNWESTADEFLAFKEKASYATGFIQGAEFILNVARAIPQELEQIEAEIKNIKQPARQQAEERNRGK